MESTVLYIMKCSPVNSLDFAVTYRSKSHF